MAEYVMAQLLSQMPDFEVMDMAHINGQIWICKKRDGNRVVVENLNDEMRVIIQI
jgi:hypothetical protein